jgi:esterase
MKLHFRKIGEGDPLIILHGLFGSSDNWQTLAKRFAENNFAVYLVDQRNHGHSPHSDEFNFKVMSEDILELIEGSKIENTNIIGHSMGGKTAMELALDHPDKISKLIVVDMAPKKYSDSNSKISKALAEINLSEISTRKEAEKKLEEKIPDVATRQFLLKNLYWKESGRLEWRFNLNVINEQIANMSEAVHGELAFQKPALFIRGENSNYILKTDEPLIRQYFPKAEIKTVPRAGHWVHADAPEWLLENCVEFLKK